MPTLAGDVQAVLADDKVLFQNQEVAFVVAEDRYIAADAIELVEVDYEELPALVDPFQALAPDAPVLREDLEGKTSRCARRAQASQPHLHLGGRRSGGDRARPSRTPRSRSRSSSPTSASTLVRSRPAAASPRWTRSGASSRSTAPSRRRTWCARSARSCPGSRKQDPRHRARHRRRLRQQGRGLSGLRLRDRRLDRPRRAGEVDRGPDREPLGDRLCPRLPHDRRARGDQGRPDHGRCACHVLADHGAFDACADPTKYPAGLFSIVTGSYDIPAAQVTVDGVYTNKAPGGVAYRCSFRVTEAFLPDRAHGRRAGAQARDRPGRDPRRNFIKAEQFPYKSALGWEYDSGDYHDRAAKGDGRGRLRGPRAREQAEKREKGRADGHRRQLLHRDRRRRADPQTATSSASACSTAARSASTRPAARSPAWAPRARARATRRPMPRSWRPRSGFPRS